jgi:hypothetical protein
MWRRPGPAHSQHGAIAATGQSPTPETHNASPSEWGGLALTVMVSRGGVQPSGWGTLGPGPLRDPD